MEDLKEGTGGRKLQRKPRDDFYLVEKALQFDFLLFIQASAGHFNFVFSSQINFYKFHEI